jgi:hypothetical protein
MDKLSRNTVEFIDKKLDLFGYDCFEKAIIYIKSAQSHFYDIKWLYAATSLEISDWYNSLSI